MKAIRNLLLPALIGGLMSAPARAEERDATELAKETQNPVAKLISVPFQNNTNFGFGPHGKQQNILNIQPVVPITLNEDWNLITRTILPVVSNPWPQPKDGVGDVLETLFFSPAKPINGLILGGGPALSIPTGSDRSLTTGKWAAGPAAVGLQMQGQWVYGALVNNLWSFAGQDDRAATSMMTVQPFINYNFKSFKGAYLTTSPIMTANWKATDSGNRWTVPAGAGIGKLFFAGKLPVNASIAYYNNVIRSNFGPSWQLRSQIQILLPKWIFTGKKAA